MILCLTEAIGTVRVRVALVIFSVIFLIGCTAPDTATPAFVGADISGSDLGKGWRLTDHMGRLRQALDFHGKVVALFFGYTHCPDVCPTTMYDLAQAIRSLGTRGREVQVLFVTLDPERDTQQVLAQYVPSFNPEFLGLRGSAENTAKVAEGFKVFYQKQASNGRDGYSIDHSAGIYVFDKKGNPRIFLNHGQAAHDIAHDLGLLL